jgi:hypothetical protein
MVIFGFFSYDARVAEGLWTEANSTMRDRFFGGNECRERLALAQVQVALGPKKLSFAPESK